MNNNINEGNANVNAPINEARPPMFLLGWGGDRPEEDYEADDELRFTHTKVDINRLDVNDPELKYLYVQFIDPFLKQNNSLENTEPDSDLKPMYRANRQLLKTIIGRVFTVHNMEIPKMKDEFGYKFQFGRKVNQYNLFITLPEVPFLRENPSLNQFLKKGKTLYELYTPEIEIKFGQITPEVQDTQIYLHDVNVDQRNFALQLITEIFQTFLKVSGTGPDPSNVKAKRVNISSRRVLAKLLEAKVGDPYFAKYMAKFHSTLPAKGGPFKYRIPPNNNQGAINTTLFEGGKRRKTRRRQKGKKRATTRK